LFQDKKSEILLETNSRRSSSKWTWALNIQFLFLADHVAKEDLKIEYKKSIM
jgi:hypothetical protein